jgi:hypothetical protein
VKGTTLQRAKPTSPGINHSNATANSEIFIGRTKNGIPRSHTAMLTMKMFVEVLMDFLENTI